MSAIMSRNGALNLFDKLVDGRERFSLLLIRLFKLCNNDSIVYSCLVINASRVIFIPTLALQREQLESSSSKSTVASMIAGWLEGPFSCFISFISGNHSALLCRFISSSCLD